MKREMDQPEQTALGMLEEAASDWLANPSEYSPYGIAKYLQPIIAKLREEQRDALMTRSELNLATAILEHDTAPAVDQPERTKCQLCGEPMPKASEKR